MRPLRLLLLLFCFIALPIFLTCISIFSAREAASDPLSTRYESRSSRLRTLFSFHAPSALFSPSAIISLTDDNSTFFLARPAAFGPLLSPKGMEGQLWVGRGFGDDTLGKNGEISIAGWEFGCSDVPGWGHENSKRSEQSIPLEKSQRAAATIPGRDSADSDMLGGQQKTSDAELDSTDDVSSEDVHVLPTEDDGTDDYLHHPLPDSNPAESGLPGEPAEKSKKKTHADIESLQESAEIAGKVVLLSRGGCGFLEKVKWAQRRGGIAVIVGDDERGAQLTTMYARGDTSNVTIPAIFTSFTSAHLLSSLVPPEVADRLTTEEVGPKLVGKDGFQNANAIAVGNGPTFTSKATSTLRPSILPATDSQHLLSRNRKGWVRNVLSKAGLRGESDSPGHPVEDSRRPPSSGNIDWVLLEDWNEEDQKQTLIKGQPVPTSSKTVLSITSTSKSSPARLHRPTGDDFVIGVQDWRDVDLVAPRPAHGMKDDNKQDKPGSPVKQISRSSSPPASNPAETGPLKGGSITPGSGEYDQQKAEGSRRPKSKGAGAGKDHQQKPNHQSMPAKSWFRFWKSGVSERTEVTAPERMPTNSHPQSPYHSAPKSTAVRGNSPSQEDEHKGLWVTLTPTDVSTSPFFDTLLVLVVSPLVTLTIVYALLLLRSRIRRRRWRAPKSVVERLPVRTYHTMSTSSSTTSSQVASPDTSSPNSPLLRSTPRSISRNRPRSQTTTAVMTSSSTETKESPPTGSPKEKPTAKPMKRKRYTGRQVECVVCLEEYVDGESRVMSLPCGHEFHAECITPWLTTRRRTCPICKGDVVRSMARANAGHTEDQREEGEETSADIQDRVAETVNESPTASIPIPLRLEDVDDDSDIERGQDIDDTLNERNTAAPRSAWRNIVSGSVSALSGETVWRQSPRDRSR